MLRHADELAAGGRARPTNVGARVASIVGRERRARGASPPRCARTGSSRWSGPPASARRRSPPRRPARCWTACPTAPGSSSSARCAPPARCCPRSATRSASAASARAATRATATRSASCASGSTRARLLVVLDNAEHLVPDLGAVAARPRRGRRRRERARDQPPAARPRRRGGRARAPARRRHAPRSCSWRAPPPRAPTGSPTRPSATPSPDLPPDRRPAAGGRARRRAACARCRPPRSPSGSSAASASSAAAARCEASIEASHALLTADEQELFRRLSVFAGPFGLEDAEQVGGGDGLDHDAVLDLLVALTEHSMVQAEGGSPRRYRMLEALRDHGRARLDERAAAAAARRHATHFAPLSPSRSRAQVDRLGAEAVGDPLVPFHWDIDAASRWAVAHGETDLALDLATGMGAFHHLVGTVTLGRERIDEALALAAATPRGGSRRCGGRSRCCCASCGCPRPPRRSSAARELIGRHGSRRERNELRAFEAQLALCAGRPRRGRARERRRLRGGPAARRAPHGGVRRLDRRHGRAHAREPGRPRSSSSPPRAST